MIPLRLSIRLPIVAIIIIIIMYDVIVRNNNALLDMGWGFDKHEDDLFLKKKSVPDNPMTCLARMKRISGGICNWFSMCILKPNVQVGLETKIWVSRSDQKIYVWDTIGRVESKEQNKSVGFYGFSESVPGMDSILKLVKRMMLVMLMYRIGEVAGYQIAPMNMPAVASLRNEWELMDAACRADLQEPGVFKQTEKHLETLAKGLISYELASFEEIMNRADWPEKILVHDGEVREFHVK